MAHRRTVVEGSHGRSGRRLAAACVLALAAGPVRGAAPEPPTATAILERAETVRSPEMDYALDFDLHIVNPKSTWKERTASYSMIASGKDRSIILLRDPASFHPGLLLIAQGEYWLLLPKSTVPFQLSSRHLLNGDVANGDLARGNLLAQYAPRLEGEERVDGADCWRLELARTNPLGIHPRIRMWITRDAFRPLRADYFGESGEMTRRVRYEDYRDGPLGVRAMRLVVDDHLHPGQRTVMTFTNLRRFDPSPLTFAREQLPALRDLALSKWEAEGVQASLEELLVRLRAAPP